MKLQQLEDAGFSNLVLCPNPDIEDGFNPLKKKDGEIHSVTINGTSEFKKNYSYDNDVLIRIIYHTFVDKDKEAKTPELGENEIKITFSSKQLKGKDHEDVVKQLKDAGFTNITEEKIEDIKRDSKLGFLAKKDGEVEKVSIDNNDSFYTEFVPLSIARLSAEDMKLKNELGVIVLQAITKIINRLSGKHSIRELSSGTNAIRDAILNDDEQVLYWKQHYGFSLTNLVIENIGYSDQTRKMMDSAYESRLQHKNMQQTINVKQRAAMTFEEQVEAVMQLEKLRQMGILTDSEFQKKKKEILGL